MSNELPHIRRGEEYSDGFDPQKALEVIRRPDGPGITIGSESATQLDQLVQGLIRQPGSVVAVIRAYNKPNIASVLDAVEQLKNDMPNLAGATVVVNIDSEKGDKDQATLKTVERIAAYKNTKPITESSFPVVGLGIDHDYTWTAGLNALPAVLSAAESQLGTTLETGIMYYSTDVEAEPEGLSRLSRAYREYGLGIGAVRVDADPNGLVTASTLPPLKDIIEYFKNPDEYVSRYRSGDPMAPRALAWARNTLSIVDLQVLKSMGGMDPSCNAQGGMEDAQFWVRVAHSQPDIISASLGVNPVKYIDHAWERLGDNRVDTAWGITLGEGQQRKLNNEALARFGNAAHLLDNQNYDPGLKVPAARQDYLFL